MMEVKDDLPAPWKATALIMSDTGGLPSTLAAQGLGEGLARGLLSGNVLLLVLDGTHPYLTVDGPKSVAVGMIQGLQLLEIDVIQK